MPTRTKPRSKPTELTPEAPKGWEKVDLANNLWVLCQKCEKKPRVIYYRYYEIQPTNHIKTETRCADCLQGVGV